MSDSEKVELWRCCRCGAEETREYVWKKDERHGPYGPRVWRPKDKA